MLTKQKDKHFYIFDYFLDGYFLKWEEVEGDCPVCGQTLAINLENGTEVVTQVVEIEPISETESRILLSSC
ncbi:MAG: hypothetical protein QNJ53_20050 [Pleurocapsa sp. MO_192.B19]|nr:hypothetical protein [Pleurocapsa sp. MO_192.B19]